MCIASQLMSLSHFLSSSAYEGVLINRLLNIVNQKRHVMLILLLSVWTKSYGMTIQMKLFSSTLVLSYIWFRLQKNIRSETC